MGIKTCRGCGIEIHPDTLSGDLLQLESVKTGKYIYRESCPYCERRDEEIEAARKEVKESRNEH